MPDRLPSLPLAAASVGVSGLGLGLGPIALGLIAAPYGILWAFAVGAVSALAGSVWTLLLARAPTRAGV